MLRTKLFAAVFAAVMLSASAFAVTFTTLDNPGDPTFNQLLGINDSGVIVGYYGSGAAGHPNMSYTIPPPYSSNLYASAQLPASVQTQATAINKSGVVVGFWSPTNVGNGTDAYFGFGREANGFTYLSINNPNVSSYPEVNQIRGINESQLVVGYYNDQNGVSHGFTYSLKTGVFTPVTLPGNTSVGVTGISNNDEICGFAISGTYISAFIAKTNGELLASFGVPGSSNTQMLGVNSQGIAVGFYLDQNNIPHGILCNVHTRSITYLDDPEGVNGTMLNGINDSGEIVGSYIDAAGNSHGVLVTGAVG
ncbi:MAG: hypothetical protein WAK29_18665 [Terriglobales bacterium]